MWKKLPNWRSFPQNWKALLLDVMSCTLFQISNFYQFLAKDYKGCPVSLFLSCHFLNNAIWLSNHSIKNINLQNTTKDFSEGRLDSRLLRVIAALGTCSLWFQSSFLSDLSYCHHVYIVLFSTFYLIADARHYYLLITCWKGNMYVGQQCSALKILNSKGQSHSEWVTMSLFEVFCTA